MGLFVSIPHSYPLSTFFPRRQADSNAHVPNSLPPPPSTGLSSLTSSLASHTRRLGNLLRRLTCGRIRPSDIEEGLPSANNGGVVPAAEAATQVAQISTPSGRRRALLIGISYHGELLNTHQDVDRYRDVLIGTHHLHLSLRSAQRHPQILVSNTLLDFEVSYGYRPEDITVLKDDPAFADHLQPTRENIVSTFSPPSPLDGCAHLPGDPI
jgi:hypothetical protein